MSEENKKDHWPFWVAIAFFSGSIIAYIINFYNAEVSDKSGDWGTFGDFVGGFTNPIIALAVLFYLWKTFDYQKRELKETREEFKRSRQEQEKQTLIQKIVAKITIKQQQVAYIKPFMDKCVNEFESIDNQVQEIVKKDASILSIPDHLLHNMDIGDLIKKREASKVHADGYKKGYNEIMAEIVDYEKDLDKI